MPARPLKNEAFAVWSYNIGAGQSGLIVVARQRAEWTQEALPGHGLALSVGLSPYRLKDDFHVGVCRWDETGQLLRVPYLLVDVAGTFELHLIDGKWSFHPDRGAMEGNWWKPFSPVAATHPTK